TERKQADLALLSASHKWRTTFDAMLDPVALLSLDGTVTQYNQAFAEFCGQDIKALKGRKCFEIVHQTKTHIEHCPLVRLRQSAARETMELALDDRVLFVIADPVKSQAGELVGVVHIIRDITEQKKAKEALEQSNARYQMVAEIAHDFIIITDLNHNITFANKAVSDFLKGVDPVGLKLSDFTPPEDRARQEDMMMRRRAGEGSIISFDWPLVDAEGHMYYLDVRSQLVTQEGKPSGVLFVARDVTERRQAEAERLKLERQLFEAQKMEAIGTLAGGIAHDFNNILAAIIGYAEMANGEKKDDVRKKYMDGVLTAAERAKHLVSQILVFGRRSEHDKKKLDLRIIVEEALKLIRATIPANIDIRTNLPAAALLVHADAIQMHQVIMNICTNAVQAMGEKGGVLEVTLSREDIAASLSEKPGLSAGAYVRMNFSDTGPGMDPGIIERIFDPFFTTKEIGQGTGLGLSVVYGIVKNHDGAVTVSSLPGRGTTFSVYLPAETAFAVKAGPDIAEVIAQGRGERILFVDDEKTLVELGEQILTALGYHVTACLESSHALQLYRRNPEAFDLIITDMTMPQLSGGELAREALRLRPDQAIILCSGYSDYMDSDKARAMGIRSFLFKPVARRDLAAAVRKALDEKPSWPDTL
ncbi:MAG: PAS domain S-box protein, partial [Smithellaceae bacterium]